MAAARDRANKWRQHNFYEVLGLPHAASAAEVKKGFRKIALTCHPDKVPEAERARATKHFQLIAEAYEVLSDAALRKQYDDIRPDAGKSGGSRASSTAATGYQQRQATGYPQRQATGYPQRQAAGSHPATATTAPRRPAAPGWSQPQPTRQQPKQATEIRLCEGCDARCAVTSMRRCPLCPQLICPKCDTCINCLPEDSDGGSKTTGGGRDTRGRPSAAGPRKAMPAATPHAATRASQAPAASAQGRPEAFGSKQVSPAGQQARQPTAAASKEQRSQARSRATPHGWGAQQEDGGEVWMRGGRRVEEDPEDESRSPSPDAEKALDMVEMLIAMGFTRREAQAARARTSSVEAAVEYLMMRSASDVPEVPDPSDGGGVYDVVGRLVEKLPSGGQVYDAAANIGEKLPAGKDVYGLAARLGEKVPAKEDVYDAAARLGESLPAKEDLYDAAARIGAGIASFVPTQGDGEQQGSILALEADDRKGKLVADLVALGFTDSQAHEAARRCSSVEAAVEWLSCQS